MGSLGDLRGPFTLLVGAACICGLYTVALAGAIYLEHWRQGSAFLTQNLLNALWPFELWLASTYGAFVVLKLGRPNISVAIALLPLLTLVIG